MIESILQAGADSGEIDAARLTAYTARAGTALINQQLLLTGAPPNKRQLAQIVDTVVHVRCNDCSTTASGWKRTGVYPEDKGGPPPGRSAFAYQWSKAPRLKGWLPIRRIG